MKADTVQMLIEVTDESGVKHTAYDFHPPGSRCFSLKGILVYAVNQASSITFHLAILKDAMVCVSNDKPHTFGLHFTKPRDDTADEATIRNLTWDFASEEEEELVPDELKSLCQGFPISIINILKWDSNGIQARPPTGVMSQRPELFVDQDTPEVLLNIVNVFRKMRQPCHVKMFFIRSRDDMWVRQGLSQLVQTFGEQRRINLPPCRGRDQRRWEMYQGIRSIATTVREHAVQMKEWTREHSHEIQLKFEEARNRPMVDRMLLVQLLLAAAILAAIIVFSGVWYLGVTMERLLGLLTQKLSVGVGASTTVMYPAKPSSTSYRVSPWASRECVVKIHI